MLCALLFYCIKIFIILDMEIFSFIGFKSREIIRILKLVFSVYFLTYFVPEHTMHIAMYTTNTNTGRNKHYWLWAKSGNPTHLCYYILSPAIQRRSERDLKRGSYVDVYRRARRVHLQLLNASEQYSEVHLTGQEKIPYKCAC